DRDRLRKIRRRQGLGRLESSVSVPEIYRDRTGHRRTGERSSIVGHDQIDVVVAIEIGGGEGDWIPRSRDRHWRGEGAVVLALEIEDRARARVRHTIDCHHPARDDVQHLVIVEVAGDYGAGGRSESGVNL